MPIADRSLPIVPSWDDHVAEWGNCLRCDLGGQRDRICLARGTIPCDVLFIGEAPGMSEDAVGQPFVGPAGVLLDQIIDRAVPPEFACALTNLVCCFPREAKQTDDHQPKSSEIQACEPRLVQFVNIVRPRLIVCVGRLSTEWVDHNDTVPCVDIDHPAFILRMPLAQRQMAVQRCIVRVRCALEDALAANKQFTKWENGGHAEETTRQRLRRGYDRAYSEDDLPF